MLQFVFEVIPLTEPAKRYKTEGVQEIFTNEEDIMLSSLLVKINDFDNFTYGMSWTLKWCDLLEGGA